MLNIAVLGYGVVGSGVVELIQQKNPVIKSRLGRGIKVKKILDIRDFPHDPNKDLITKDADEILKDESIKIVVETIGGTGFAYDITKRALKAGKSVVTSNKELVATHGPELLALAAENEVSYLFEASVGGGIPIIRPLYNCLAANDINSITGILNGTTNYILTAMNKQGKAFDDALKEAQSNGYAEADPTADVEGHDACRKIAILSSIAYNQFVDYRDIETEGITRIAPDDFHYANQLGGTIKLIGESRKVDGGIYARVHPAILDANHPLSHVDDVFNAILVEGDAVGDAMFYGKGAGKLPTASAVVADILDIMKKNRSHTANSGWDYHRKAWVLNQPATGSQLYVRMEGVQDKTALKELLAKELGQVRFYENLEKPEQLVFVTQVNEALGISQLTGRLESFGYKPAIVLQIMDKQE